MIRSEPALSVAETEFQVGAAALDHMMDLISYVRGNTNRDMNRAIDQAAKVLGVSYEEMHKLLKLAHLHGSLAAVQRFGRPISAKPDDGFVYFAEDTRERRIKIGFSANPTVRIDVLSRLAGTPLVELARFPGLMLNEHVAHVLARPALIGGEWYDPDILVSIAHFKFLRVTLRPDCLSPGNCAGYGSHTCHHCRTAAAAKNSEAA